MKRVLFVCVSNICRSPILEGALRYLAVQQGLSEEVFADSCGLGWFHLGEAPDPRAFAAAKKRGILMDHRAQQFRDSFFEEFDFIFAVNDEIKEQLKLRAKSKEQKEKVYLATAFSEKYKNSPIPDPYYREGDGFNEVVEMSLDCCKGVISRLVCCEG